MPNPNHHHPTIPKFLAKHPTIPKLLAKTINPVTDLISSAFKIKNNYTTVTNNLIRVTAATQNRPSLIPPHHQQLIMHRLNRLLLRMQAITAEHQASRPYRTQSRFSSRPIQSIIS